MTAADSNTDTMSNLCSSDTATAQEEHIDEVEGERVTNDVDRDDERAPASLILLKFVWGISIGVIAWVMVSFASIDGIKMMSNLGGLPAMFIIICINLSLFVLLKRVYHGDTFEPPAKH